VHQNYYRKNEQDASIYAMQPDNFLTEVYVTGVIKSACIRGTVK